MCEELFPPSPLSTGTFSGLDLCRSCEYCYGLHEFDLCQFSSVWKTLLEVFSILAGSLHLPAPIPHGSLILKGGGGGLMETSHLGFSVQISHSLHIAEFQVSVLDPISYKRRLL